MADYLKTAFSAWGVVKSRQLSPKKVPGRAQIPPLWPLPAAGTALAASAYKVSQTYLSSFDVGRAANVAPAALFSGLISAYAAGFCS